MNDRRWFVHLMSTALAALAVLSACAESSTDAGGGGTNGADAASGTSGGVGARQPRFKCCLEDESFSCPDKATMDRCAGTTFDLAACHAACGADGACHNACDEKQAEQPKPDSSPCTKVDVPTDEWCVRPPPSNDCTQGEPTCKEASDCVDRSGIVLPGYWCNTARGRCFDMGKSCVGTKCKGPSDCASGEQCDQAAGQCAKL